MRRFPYSWDTLRTKLGFRKTKARRRSIRRHRLSRVEPLEVRAYLSGDPITTLDDEVAAFDGPVITSTTIQSQPMYILTNVTPRSEQDIEEAERIKELGLEEEGAPAELFLVTTEYTDEGPKAVVSLNPVIDHPPAGLQTLKLELQLDGQVLESYEILVDIAEERFRTKFLNDRIEAIRAKAPQLSPEEQFARFRIEDPLVAEGRALVGFVGPLTAQQEAARSKYEESLEAEETPVDLAEKSTEDLLALAADVTREVESLRTDIDLTSERVAIYNEVESRIHATKASRIEGVTDVEEQRLVEDKKSLQELGLLMVKDIALDLASDDAVVKAAAEGLRDELIAIGDVYHTAFTGLGVDREVQRTVTSRGDLKAYALVESGHYVFDSHVAVDLAGQPAMVQVTRLNPHPYASLITVEESPAVEDGFIDYVYPSYLGGSSEVLAAYGSNAGLFESFVRFNFSTVSTPVLTSAIDFRIQDGGYGDVDMLAWKSILPGDSGSPSDWNESNLSWEHIYSTLNLDDKLSEFEQVGTWTGSTTTSVDLRELAQRALVYGDANGNGVFDPDGVAGDIEAFHLAVVDWDAYVAEYGPRAHSLSDLLARTDGGLSDGIINTDDVSDFLRRFGRSAGDFNLNGTVDGTDWAIYQSSYGTSEISLASARFGQGDANFDGIVDAADAPVFEAVEGITGLTPITPEVMLWLRPSDDTTATGFASQENTGFDGPTLDIIEASDLVLNDFTVSGTDLRVDYSVLGTTFSGVQVQLFKEGIATPLYTSSTQSGALGAHSLTIAASSLSSIVEGDVVYAKIIGTPTSGTQTNTSNDRLNFEFSTDSHQVVNSLDDAGMDTLIRSKHTLRELLEADAALGWIEKITFDESLSGNVLALAGSQLLVADDVVIEGPGSALLALDGRSSSRVLWVQTGVEATISGLTIMNGQVTGSSSGGGIYNSGDLTLSHVRLFANQSSFYGGGLNSSGERLTVEYSTFDSNIGRYGAGVYLHTLNSGEYSFHASTFSSNHDASLQGAGGGLLIKGETSGVLEHPVLITNSTFSGNNVDLYGGGLRIQRNGALIQVINSTFTENFTGSSSGGISAVGGAQVLLHNSIVAGNSAPSTPDLSGSFNSSSSHNLIGIKDSTLQIYNDTNGNQVGTALAPIDPVLAPLGDYGGATQTHLVFPDSPAVDAGSDTIANLYGLTTDQMGFTRFYDVVGVNDAGGNLTDIGAYEDPEHVVNYVDSGNDIPTGGQVTLRQAIERARQAYLDSNEAQTITFAPGLFSGPQTTRLVYDENNDGRPDPLNLDFDVSIIGPGADLLTLSGNDATRVVSVAPDTVASISGVSIADGYAREFVGGGIYTQGDLTLDSVWIHDNHAQYGGGIYMEGGQLTVSNSTISNNVADPNYAGYADGGGIYLARNPVGTPVGGVTLENVTISENSASSAGGGLYADVHSFGGYAGLLVTIVNSAIVENEVGSYGEGGGVYLVGGGTGDTFTQELFTLHNTIIAKNTSWYEEPNDISYAPYARVSHQSSYNLIGYDPVVGDDHGLLNNGSNGNQVGGEGSSSEIDPLLTPLGLYGGVIPTHMPLYNSPAAGNGQYASGLTRDARGEEFYRVLGLYGDVGPVEANVFEQSGLNVHGTRNSDSIQIFGHAVILDAIPGYIVASDQLVVSNGLDGDDILEIDESYQYAAALFGGAGNDVLNGGKGTTNYFFGGEGDDYYQHHPETALSYFYEGLGNDTYVLRDMENQPTSEVRILPESAGAPSGTDTLDLAFLEYGGITVSLESDLLHQIQGSGSGLKLRISQTSTNGAVDIENLRGTAFDDVLIGNELSNYIDGMLGDDSLDGRANIDILQGGAGEDAIVADNVSNYQGDRLLDSDAIPRLRNSQSDENFVPVVQPISAKAITAGQNVTIDINAHDIDESLLGFSYSLIGDTYGASVQSNGQFTWTAPFDTLASTTYSFTVRVADNGTPEAFVDSAIQIVVDPIRIGVRAIQHSFLSGHIEWSVVPSATQYVIERRANGDSWTTLAITSSTSYSDDTLEPIVVYDYRVKAIDTSSQHSRYSDPVRVITADRANGLALALQAYATASGARVSFTVFDEEDFEETQIAILRQSSSEEGFETIFVGYLQDFSMSSSTDYYFDDLSVYGANSHFRYAVQQIGGGFYTRPFLLESIFIPPTGGGLPANSSNPYLLNLSMRPLWSASLGAGVYLGDAEDLFHVSAEDDRLGRTVVPLNNDFDENNRDENGILVPDNVDDHVAGARRDTSQSDRTELVMLDVELASGDWDVLNPTPQGVESSIRFDFTPNVKLWINFPAVGELVEIENGTAYNLSLSNSANPFSGNSFGFIRTSWQLFVEGVESSDAIGDAEITTTIVPARAPAHAQTATQKLTIVDLQPQLPGNLSVDEGELTVYVPLLGESTELDGETIELRLRRKDQPYWLSYASQSVEIVDGAAAAVFQIPKQKEIEYRVGVYFRGIEIGWDDYVWETDSDEVTSMAGSPHTISLETSSTSTVADGTTELTLVATVRDQFGNLVEDGTPVSWGVDFGLGQFVDPLSLTTTSTSNGVASVIFRASSIPGIQRVSAIAGRATAIAVLVAEAPHYDIAGPLYLDRSTGQAGVVHISDANVSDGTPVVWTISNGKIVGAPEEIILETTIQNGASSIDIQAQNGLLALARLGSAVVTANVAGRLAVHEFEIITSDPFAVELEHFIISGDVTSNGIETLIYSQSSNPTFQGEELWGFGPPLQVWPEPKDIPYYAETAVTVYGLPNRKYFIVPTSSQTSERIYEPIDLWADLIYLDCDLDLEGIVIRITLEQL